MKIFIVMKCVVLFSESSCLRGLDATQMSDMTEPE